MSNEGFRETVRTLDKKYVIPSHKLFLVREGLKALGFKCSDLPSLVSQARKC